MLNARETHAKVCEDHQAAAETYVVTRTNAYAAFQNFTEAYEDAKKVLIESGALGVDQDGNISAGWYKSDAGYEQHKVGATGNTAVGVGGGVGAVAGAIGTPAAAWVLVGSFGTASTGAAISGLSGAAATSATAAWFGGGAVAAGGLGMAAAPFVLSGIGIVAGVGIIGVAALIAGRRNNRNEKEMQDANSTMREAERRMDLNSARLKSLADWAKQAFQKLIKATGVLEATKSAAAVTNLDQALVEADELLIQLQKELPYTRLYVGRPSPVESVTQITTTRYTILMSWQDPDNGNSEITGYEIHYRPEFRGDFKFLMKTQKPEFEHYLVGFKPGGSYEYQITPVNAMGGPVNQRKKSFKAKAQSA